MVTIDQAAEYFAKHLDKAFWEALDAGTREAALSMATGDIAALGGPETLISAICEQAVYLARNYAKQTEGKVVTGQTLGQMSQTFTLLNREHPELSPRAVTLVKNYQRGLLAGGVRINRG